MSEKLILWKSVWGSHMWGVNREDSDLDKCVVYLNESEKVLLNTFDPTIMNEERHGRRVKSKNTDEHWYELSRAIRLLLKGSVSLLYGIMTPVVESEYNEARIELQNIIVNNPSKVFYSCFLKYVSDSEKAMKRSQNRENYLKHLRIAVRDMTFAINLFTNNKYEYKHIFTEDENLKDELLQQLKISYEKSPMSEEFDKKLFENYIVKWRKEKFYIDYGR